ncbi:SUMO-interacting motif-containing protein 1 [Synchiropus picturatus]
MSYMDDLRNDSPLWIEWEDDDLNLESIFHQDPSDAIEEKTQFVCPVALNQLMTGKTLTPVKDKKPKPSQLLSRQMLSLIKCTIDENYTEGTLQLVSDFFKSGCHPPKNLTIHLLDILLNPKSVPYHCVCSFNQLMKIQRHHMADRDTVPWSWDLLDSVMNNEDPAKMLRSEVVRMFLDYVLQTLTDNYMEKRTDSDLCNSIAKATLSCERHFGHVRDVIKWIFAAIVKSPESEDKIEAAKESDEKMRIVSSLQGMLALALDVDQCPALISSKLCQELFNTLITCMPRRAHRMMFLESLQSQPLRCKLLEQLLEYSCPVKVCLPMSLSLLLHFLQNCTPIPDLKGGAEKWRDWEELLQLLWMLLLSYNKTMKGYLSTSASECSNLSSNMIFKKEDRLTKASVCEGVDTFRSRSRHDLDNAPFHVEESLSYLMEYLLAACQE